MNFSFRPKEIGRHVICRPSPLLTPVTEFRSLAVYCFQSGSKPGQFVVVLVPSCLKHSLRDFPSLLGKLGVSFVSKTSTPFWM